jgi:glycosyltransferase involved in cell wall biosynthesis
MKLCVVLPTHNPDAGRLAATLKGLAQQDLAQEEWELVIVDNGSATPVTPALAGLSARVVREDKLGLTHARRRGFLSTSADLIVLVDDDNVLAPHYLSAVVRLFSVHPDLGAAGGPCRPQFESPLPPWATEFLPLLALRDFGAETWVGTWARSPEDSHWCYPDKAPIGAGMALRRAAISGWLERGPGDLPDRQGRALSSGGDNDLVMTLLTAGWKIGYFPELAITHLIPSARLQPDYLARLNRGIQRSWMQVLSLHGANPWPPLGAWGARARIARAWFSYRGWSRPVGHIRWQGVRGHFEGRTLMN